MEDTRTARLANQLRQEIAVIIHQELKDPRLGFVTITRVELSKDLRYAKVGYSCLGDAEQKERSQEALDHAGSFIYGLVKKRLRLRVIPQMVFQYDPSIEGSIAMADALDRLKQAENP
ncbi:MAG: 30S ribosome-binding factor RbfA [Candidatus Omnitrophica bacterium]|nr:30S ribosome-binding factor RbfA [Candidatus Omnitrophota bacterium]MBI2174704.1 30S ribosome-binding factor RbfA [Candidatus Omnitrophota bacterium]MBI3010277.1 30S ribosome-binding factor RbfA [Candidatus Omnitrophota bacterium]